MIDGDLLEPQSEAILVTLRNGFMTWQYDVVDMLSTEIGGVFIGIEQVTHKGHRYWLLRLKDETNELGLLFVYRSALFKDLLFCLHGQEFECLNIESSWDDEEKRNKLRIYADDVRLYPVFLALPPIKRKKDRITGKVYCDYSARMQRICEIVDEINKGLSNTKG